LTAGKPWLTLRCVPLPILPSPPATPAEPPVAVDLAGSVLANLSRRGGFLVAVFSPALVSGATGRRWRQEAQALLLAGEAHGDLTELPCPIASATLRVAGEELRGPLPLPFERPGAVELELVDAIGRRAFFVGARLEIGVAGPAVAEPAPEE